MSLSYCVVRRFAALLLFAVIAASRLAVAQTASPEETARQHHERGTMHYNLGQFEDAIAEYRKGYEQKPDPIFLFNIAQTYRQLGAHEKALFFYQRYFSSAPDAPNRAEVQARIAELEPLVSADRHALAAAPPSEPALSPILTMRPPRPAAAAPPRVWHRWWFWAGVGGVLLGGVALGLAASSWRSESPPRTDLGGARFF